MKKLSKTTFSRILTSCALGFSIIATSSLAISNAALASNITADTFMVDMNKTQIMRLPSAAAAVVVGNPEIADVSVHSPTLLFVVGRGVGTTNVIVLDSLGQTIISKDIHVQSIPTSSSRRVYKAGDGWNSYDCTPFCQPSPTPGDTAEFAGQYSATGPSLNNSGVPATVTPFGTAGGMMSMSPGSIGAPSSMGASGMSGAPSPNMSQPAMRVSKARNRSYGTME